MLGYFFVILSLSSVNRCHLGTKDKIPCTAGLQAGLNSGVNILVVSYCDTQPAVLCMSHDA
jgi:hypothetical protein